MTGLLAGKGYILKYLISGGSAFLTEYSVFLALFYLLKINIVIANIFSFVSGFFISFMLNRAWVFKSSNHMHSLKHQVALYLGLGLANLLLSTASVKLLHYYLAGYAAKMLSVILIAIWNYFAYKNVLFREAETSAN